MKRSWSCVRIVIAVSLGLSLGCGIHQSRKTYSSPHDNFDVPVPDSGFFSYQPSRFQEASDDLGGRVVFFDTQLFKVLTSITYRQLPAGSDGVSKDVEIRSSAVRSFFHDYTLPELFEPVSGDIEVLREEIVGSGSSVEYFAVVRISGGSVLTDGVGKRMDSIRAVLIFPHGDYMYMLGFDNMTLRAMMAAPADSAAVFDRVTYQRQAGRRTETDLEDTADLQLELNIFAVVALARLTEFKSTIVFN
jgi:hypothetical protein